MIEGRQVPEGMEQCGGVCGSYISRNIHSARTAGPKVSTKLPGLSIIWMRINIIMPRRTYGPYASCAMRSAMGE